MTGAFLPVHISCLVALAMSITAWWLLHENDRVQALLQREEGDASG